MTTPTREQCLEWADEIYGPTSWSEASKNRLAEFSRRVWNEAINEAVRRVAHCDSVCAVELRKLRSEK